MEALQDWLCLLPECCTAGVAPVRAFGDPNRAKLEQLLPGCRSVIVTGHRIEHSLEWVWFPMRAEREGSSCPADLHAHRVALELVRYLTDRKFWSLLIPYPGVSGIPFKELAVKAGLGVRGDNDLLLHPQWGPWIHLRAILTEADLNPSAVGSPLPPVCIHCGACRAACPAGAIHQDGFSGLECKTFVNKRREGLGPNEAHIFNCEICARVCPIGIPPAELGIKRI